MKQVRAEKQTEALASAEAKHCLGHGRDVEGDCEIGLNGKRRGVPSRVTKPAQRQCLAVVRPACVHTRSLFSPELETSPEGSRPCSNITYSRIAWALPVRSHNTLNEPLVELLLYCIIDTLKLASKTYIPFNIPKT